MGGATCTGADGPGRPRRDGAASKAKDQRDAQEGGDSLQEAAPDGGGSSSSLCPAEQGSRGETEGRQQISLVRSDSLPTWPGFQGCPGRRAVAQGSWLVFKH